jgi:hypothetical protein
MMYVSGSWTKDITIRRVFETADGARREHLRADTAFHRRQQGWHTGFPRLFGFEEHTIRTILSRHGEEKKQHSGNETACGWGIHVRFLILSS